jgi:spore maturation protein CgeB
MTEDSPPASEHLRILAVASQWAGSNSRAYVESFRRLGHSVRVLPSEHFVPGAWRGPPLRALRRALEPALVREFSQALLREIRLHRPHLFFVYKGRYVEAHVVRAMRSAGACAINVYPDVSFMAHGKYLPSALPEYDWLFTTKSFGLEDLKTTLGVSNASVLPHGFDPTIHRPVPLNPADQARYGCDVSFIGTWSPKKEATLNDLVRARPRLSMKIWGYQWDSASLLRPWVQGEGVLGLEYAKALAGSRISLGLLSEARPGSSSGDLITSRTFHIPAAGSFMLHEGNDELASFFAPGLECSTFSSPSELLEKIDFFLEHEEQRAEIARLGHARCLASAYSIDDRALALVAKARELSAASAPLPDADPTGPSNRSTQAPAPEGKSRRSSRLYIGLRRRVRKVLTEHALLDKIFGDQLRRSERRLGLVRRAIPREGGALEVHGYLLSYRPQDMGVAAPLILHGDYEPETRLRIQRLLQPGSTFVDLGAHIGYFSLLAARSVGPTGRVFAFEPTPATREVLKSNVAHNGFEQIVRVAPFAVAETPGTVRFRTFPNSSESNGVAPEAETGNLLVECTSLDAFFAELDWPRVDVIKMDVEGAELSALRGMRELSNRNPQLSLIFEFLLAHMGEFQIDPCELVATLRSLGFSRFEILHRSRPGPIDLPEQLEELKRLARRFNVNLLASKPCSEG